MQHHQAGRLDEAIAHYDRVLELEPDHEASWINRGVALKQLKRLETAIESFQRVLKKSPRNVDALYNLANALLAAKRQEEARVAYLRTLEVNQDHTGALANLSLLLRDMDRAPEGIDLLKRALDRIPDQSSLLHDLGVLLLAVKRPTEAVEPLRRAEALGKGNSELLFSLSVALVDLERWDEALQSLTRMLMLDPVSLRARSLQALVLSKIDPVKHERLILDMFRACLAEQPDHRASLLRLVEFHRSRSRRTESIKLLNQELEKTPDDPVLLRELGRSLWEEQRHEAARAVYARIVCLDPRDAHAQHDLGVTSHHMGLLEEAVEAARVAVGLDPTNAGFHASLGQIYTTQGRIDLALSSFRDALERDPACVLARHGEARARLLSGDFEKGWESYESRWDAAGVMKRKFRQPEWKGDPLKGRSLFLHAEQGIGDSLQFFRFIPQVLRRGGPVHLECPPELTRLFKRVPGVQVWAAGDKLPLFDLQLPLISLGRVLKVRAGTIPGNGPYLPAQSGRLLTRRPPADPVRHIGIVWAGNANHGNDRARSVSLESLLRLTTIPSTRFYSFQVGSRAQDLERSGTRGLIRDLSPMLKDFAETADLLQDMDLVISVDTAVAHLAGALARPVWTLVPFAPDWRWQLYRRDSPWYPTMTLYRQQDPRSWESTFESLHQDLARWVRARSRP